MPVTPIYLMIKYYGERGKEVAKVWHSENTESVMNELNVTNSGLTSQEAKQRLTQYGPNELKKEKGKSPLKLLLGQFTNVLMIILLIAIGLSIAVGEVADALIILAIVVASAVLGFTQEYRSEKAVEALKKMTAPTANVIRDGKETRIPAVELVPGDIVVLYTGDKIPADARLIEAFTMKTDEAPLTGESAPVDKSTSALPEQTQLNDRDNMVFSGTVVVYGRGKAIVTNTGMTTEFGKIAAMVQSAPQEKTPLEKRMAGVGKWIGLFAVVIAISVGVVGIVVEGRDIVEMVLWAISLAVAAVPEALPAIITGALAIGMYRMAKVNAIVKRLPAVETLGSTSVICSDKTGTLTKGEMTVQRIYVNDKSVKVTGIGYSPEGDFFLDDKEIKPDEALEQLLKVAVLCNDSGLEKDVKAGKWVVKGDPTEGALVVAAEKAGIKKESLDRRENRVAEIPFSSERKRMTTIHQVDGKYVAYMKGAPEIVLGKCSKILLNGKVQILTKEVIQKHHKMTETMAQQALRNLGFAYKELPASIKEFNEEIEEDFIFVGITGMIDPPRSEVKDAISICRKAGIRVVMITGDHKLTATAVAKELTLLGDNVEEGQVLTGDDLEKMTDEQLEAVVEKVVIYARVAPEHKSRIVKAWKKKDQVVAMTGDGVNDAPALKMSDIGIAMGISGTEVSKEAADMVLADDNFASIVKAVREGREIYDNIKKYLTYLLQCNIMEILVMFIAVVSVPYIARWMSPGSDMELIGSSAIALTAVQILWINLVTDGLPAIALGVDPGDPDLMDRKPRKPTESIFTRDVKVYLVAVPLLTSALLLTAYFLHTPWVNEDMLLAARTQLFTAMIAIELTIAISARSFKYPIFKVGVFKNKYLWIAVLSSFALQLVVLYTPGVQELFDVHTPELIDWAVAALYAAIVFTTLEVGKYVTSRRKK
ncbi:MAG: cation-translocating P-type ATPase [Candidatus Bathyarchaeota archaeon]|nr:cation-translocating P-type ATPase [Candidatus Bathyarchaeota archaeon]